MSKMALSNRQKWKFWKNAYTATCVFWLWHVSKHLGRQLSFPSRIINIGQKLWFTAIFEMLIVVCASPVHLVSYQNSSVNVVFGVWSNCWRNPQMTTCFQLQSFALLETRKRRKWGMWTWPLRKDDTQIVMLCRFKKGVFIQAVYKPSLFNLFSWE